MYVCMSTVTITPEGTDPFWKAFPDTSIKINEIMKTVPGIVRITRKTEGPVMTVNVYFTDHEMLNDWLDNVWTIPEFVQRYDYNTANGINRTSTITEVTELPEDSTLTILR